jgi:hypothetical protein
MTERVWLISHARSSLFAASVLIFASLFFSSQLALAQFTQQGPKLVGTGAVGPAQQGVSVALSADGNTAIVGGFEDNSHTGAAWVFTRSGGVWTQQGSKLVGTGAVGTAAQGFGVALSADGNTAVLGGVADNGDVGAAWIFTRSSGVWTQQGSKLTGNDAVGAAIQGFGVALSADGNTAIVGGMGDNAAIGAAWVYTRRGGVWTQQGSKLVGTGAVGNAQQGYSVSLSADGNTAIMGGYEDNESIGAAWVFTRSGGVWTQQGSKLVGTGADGAASLQGESVALSADGNTAIVGGFGGAGAAWVFTRRGGVWTQQGSKLVGTGAVGAANQGSGVALSADGNTAIVGGYFDNSEIGAAWVFTRSGGAWTQQGSKLTGNDASPSRFGVLFGFSVALSVDGSTAIVGGNADNSNTGAAWVFVQSAGTLRVSPARNIAATGTQGEAFFPTSFKYELSSTIGSVNYQITGIPTWLNANFTSGTATTTPVTVTFSLVNPGSLSPGTYTTTISFTDTSNGQGNTTRLATLTVKPKHFKIMVEASPRADGTVSGGGEFAEGTSHTVTATPDTGHTFVHWTEKGSVVGTSESYKFTLDGNVTLVAHFK